MANICCDDVYFYTYTNPTAIQRLWYDLETSIICSPNPDDSWFGNLFKYVKLPTADLVLRGCVTYMEQNDNQVFLELETAWSPLYDAYASIAAHYVSIPGVFKPPFRRHSTANPVWWIPPYRALDTEIPAK